MPNISRRSLLARLPALGALPVLGPLALKLAPVATEVEDTAPESESVPTQFYLEDVGRWVDYARKLEASLADSEARLAALEQAP